MEGNLDEMSTYDDGKIVDTSVWIDYLRNIKDKRTGLAAYLIEKNELFILPVMWQEVLQGIREDKSFDLTNTAFMQHPFLPFDEIAMAI